jgi:hypothetical protein
VVAEPGAMGCKAVVTTSIIEVIWDSVDMNRRLGAEVMGGRGGRRHRELDEGLRLMALTRSFRRTHIL